MNRKVLVIGDNDLAGLAVVRSLGRAGLVVDLVAWFESHITRSSRYVNNIYTFGDPTSAGDSFSSKILNLASSNRYDIIIPVVDSAMWAILDVRAELERLAYLLMPEESAFYATQDKAATIALAQKLGIDAPRTLVASSLEEFDRWSDDVLSYPLALKPRYAGKVHIATSREQVIGRLASMLDRSPVLIQEFCAGRGAGLNVLSREGEIVAAFQHQRVHEPPRGGASSYRRSAPLSAELLNVAARMCQEMKFTGPAMFEFKVDEKTGRTPLIEVNGRFWGSLALAISAGIDFPRLAFDCLVAGKPVHAFSYKTPRFSRNTKRDFFWVLSNLKTPSNDPQLLKVPLHLLVKETANLVTGRESWDVESFTDPMPGLFSWLEVLKEVRLKISRKASNLAYLAAVGRMRKRAYDAKQWSEKTSSQSIRALFLCDGNINRSAFAAEYLNSKLCQMPKVVADSAGVIARKGRRSSRVAVEAAAQLNVDLERHEAVPLDPAMVQQADVIFVMDKHQYDHIKSHFNTYMRKVHILAAYDGEFRCSSIPDPDGLTFTQCHEIFSQLVRCVDNWIGLAATNWPEATRSEAS